MKKSYRNIAFLTELLINVLVFSVACATLAGVFAKAGVIAQETREESLANAEAYALMETWKIVGMEGIDGEMQPDGSILCHYDSNWQRTTPQKAMYSVHLAALPEYTQTGTLMQLNSTVCSLVEASPREICRLQTTIYQPKEGNRK